MESQDKERLWMVIRTLALNAGVEKIPNASMAKLYYTALKQYPIEDIETAATRVLATWRYNRMPPIAELLENMPGRDNQAVLENRANVEADRILEHLHIKGSAYWPTMNDPITRYLMTTRWNYPIWASNLVMTEVKWWIKEFIEAYRSYQEAGGVPQIEAPEEVRQLVSGIGKEVDDV